MRLGIRLGQWISLVGIATMVLLYGLTTPGILVESARPVPVMLGLPELPASPMVASDSAQPLLTAQAVLALDTNSGSVLFEKNAHTQLPPASSLKLLTALTARELFAPDEVASVSAYGIADTNQPLHTGLLLTVEELLAALLVESNNTAAYALANHDKDGYTHFIDSMNALANRLALDATRAYNPAGFDDSLSRSSAHDLAFLLRAVMLDPMLRGLVTSSRRQLTAADGRIVGNLFNTNALLTTDPRFFAGKTGTTDEAGQVLVSIATIEGNPVVLVLMGSRDRYGEMRLLADWLEERYTWVAPDLGESW